jgi:3-oxoacyl-[acyl-carrier-protein] synthase-3
MGAEAARDALKNAGLTIKDIDLILCGSGIPEQPLPCNASLIQRELGPEAAGIPSIDVGATCIGFIVGLDIAGALISTGRYRHILLVCADVASVGLNEKEVETVVLFGDAAAAAVIGPSPEAQGESRRSQILGTRLETYSEGIPFTEIRGGGSAKPSYTYSAEARDEYLFHMDGILSMRLAGRIVPPMFNSALSALNLSVDDIDLAIPHQASPFALESMCRRLEIEPERFVMTVRKYGNTISSSLPLALDESIRDGRLHRGDRVALLGAAAGFTAGVMILDF